MRAQMLAVALVPPSTRAAWMSEACRLELWAESIAPSKICAQLTGKTTLARLMVEKLRSHGQLAVLCDGDEVRDLFDVKLGYDPASRSRQTKRVLGLAKWVLRQGMMPVVAIIHPFESDRMECRRELPGYTEVYLRCDIKERIRRDVDRHERSVLPDPDPLHGPDRLPVRRPEGAEVVAAHQGLRGSRHRGGVQRRVRRIDDAGGEQIAPRLKLKTSHARKAGAGTDGQFVICH